MASRIIFFVRVTSFGEKISNNINLKGKQTPCWSVLDFWKIKFEKSSSTNWIFSLIWTGFLLPVFWNWYLQVKNPELSHWFYSWPVCQYWFWVNTASCLFANLYYKIWLGWKVPKGPYCLYTWSSQYVNTATVGLFYMLLIYSFQQTSNYSKKIVKYHAVEINSLEDGLNRTSSLSNGHESKNWANFARNWPGYKSNLARITGKNISIIGLVLTRKILAGFP